MKYLIIFNTIISLYVTYTLYKKYFHINIHRIMVSKKIQAISLVKHTDWYNTGKWASAKEVFTLNLRKDK